jgi:Ca2+-binding RTX toxin-like protein
VGAVGLFGVGGPAGAVDGTLELVSQPTGVADPDTFDAGIGDAVPSADGSRVFFETEQKLTADDTDTNRRDVYERAGGVTTLVSQPSGVADPDTFDVFAVGRSADGGRVFFVTRQKLTADDTDTNLNDVYERAGGVTTLVSQPSGVAEAETEGVIFAGASADGSRVFLGTPQKLTADDTDTNGWDVYERAGGVTTLLSQPSGVAAPDAGDAFFAGASADGSRVFFFTTQKLTAEDADSGFDDVYERAGGVTTLVSQPSGVADPDTDHVFFAGASDDGSRVFLNTRQKLAGDDTDSNLLDVYERAGGLTTLVSQPSGVADTDTGDVFLAAASADGSRVFVETAQRLTADDNDANRADIYERAGGVTTLVSQPTGVADLGTGDAFFEGASADGSRVFVETAQKLTADDTDTGRSDVYERSGGVTTLITQPSGVADPDTGFASFSGSSADGHRVFFETPQKMTPDDSDTNRDDVYERSGGVTTLVTRPLGVADPDTDNAFFTGSSDGGNRVFFETTQKMTADDTDTNRTDVYAAGSPDPPPPAPAGPAPPGPANPTPGGLLLPLPSLLPGACANQKLGSAGADLLDGSSAGDTLRGLAGNDRLNGLAGRDCLLGDTGNDRLSGGGDNDRLTGSTGRDRASGGAGNDRFAGGGGSDTANGGRGNDRLTGGAGNDKLSGSAGKDTMAAGKGNNTISAGGGRDVVNAANNKADRVNCGRGRDRVRADVQDTLTGCERVRRI